MMFSKCDPESAEEVANIFLINRKFFESVSEGSSGTSHEREIVSLEELAKAAD